MEFVEVHKGKADQIVIFVHGFNFLGWDEQNYYTQCIKSANFKGQAFLGKWDSEGIQLPLPVLSALRAVRATPTSILATFLLERLVKKFIDFKLAERKAKKEGELLLDQMKGKFAASKGKKIYLIGHSLGSLVIHHSLSNDPWEKVREIELEDVFYLGSAVLVRTPFNRAKRDWEDLLGSINGKLFNCYSKRDRILQVVPGRRTRVGRGRINSRGTFEELKYFQRITDVSFTGRRYGHIDYVKRLGPTLRRVKDKCETELELG